LRKKGKGNNSWNNRKKHEETKTHLPEDCCCLATAATAAAIAAGFRPPPLPGSPDRTAYTSYAEARLGSCTGRPGQRDKALKHVNSC
jgi:hypothetical protein